MPYNIRDIKQHFIVSLSNLYAKEELNVFFDILLEEFAGLSKIDFIIHPEASADETAKLKFIDAIERLKKHEPIQYIAGKTYFYDLELMVSPDVLIPRPETEELVDLIIKENYQLTTINYQRILDIGTGSGCIAIALKKNLPAADVSAIDISESALKLAEQNASKNNVSVNFLKADILNHSAYGLLLDTYDLIVSNPPYVRESEKHLMLPNVIEHEPYLALFVEDNDALSFYKAIADFALNGHLQQNGRLYFEINEYLYSELADLLKAKGFKNIEIKKDINDKARILLCTLKK